MLTIQSGPPANNLPPAQAAKLWKSAQDFEAMTIGQLLQPMFDTVSAGPFGGGDTEAAFKPVMIQAIGHAMEERGGLGLSGPIFQALLQAQGEKHPPGAPSVIPAKAPTVLSASPRHPRGSGDPADYQTSLAMPTPPNTTQEKSTP